MLVRAKTATHFLTRLVLLAVITSAASTWFWYDGLIAWPLQRKQALAFHELQDKTEDTTTFRREWRKLCEEKGWPATANPGEPKSDVDIYGQYLLGSVLGIGALIFWILAFRAWRRWIEMDEEGLRTNGGVQFAFEQVTMLDKKKWKRKGIAIVHFEQQGKTNRLVLDDWKYEQAPTESMLRAVESHITAEQIVGGSPEPPREEKS